MALHVPAPVLRAGVGNIIALGLRATAMVDLLPEPGLGVVAY